MLIYQTETKINQQPPSSGRPPASEAAPFVFSKKGAAGLWRNERVGTDADFEKFLHALVRDYLGADSLGAVDSLHSLPRDPSVQSVDSGAA